MIYFVLKDRKIFSYFFSRSCSRWRLVSILTKAHYRLLSSMDLHTQQIRVRDATSMYWYMLSRREGDLVECILIARRRSTIHLPPWASAGTTLGRSGNGYHFMERRGMHTCLLTKQHICFRPFKSVGSNLSRKETYGIQFRCVPWLRFLQPAIIVHAEQLTLIQTKVTNIPTEWWEGCKRAWSVLEVAEPNLLNAMGVSSMVNNTDSYTHNKNCCKNKTKKSYFVMLPRRNLSCSRRWVIQLPEQEVAKLLSRSFLQGHFWRPTECSLPESKGANCQRKKEWINNHWEALTLAFRLCSIILWCWYNETCKWQVSCIPHSTQLQVLLHFQAKAIKLLLFAQYWYEK